MIMRLLFYKHIYTKEYISLDTVHVLKNLTTDSGNKISWKEHLFQLLNAYLSQYWRPSEKVKLLICE